MSLDVVLETSYILFVLAISKLKPQDTFFYANTSMMKRVNIYDSFGKHLELFLRDNNVINLLFVVSFLTEIMVAN